MRTPNARFTFFSGCLIIAAVFFIFAPARAGVVINEFAYYLDPAGDTGQEWIELYNPDSAGADLSGYDIYPGRTPHYLVPSGFVLGPKCFVLVHLRQDGANTASDLYEGTAAGSNMPNTKGSLAVFTSGSRDSIVDFVQYGAANQTYEATAANAGIWTRNDLADTVSCGWSLGLASDGADHNFPSDWAEFQKPTPGYTNSPQSFDLSLATPYTTPLEIQSGSSFMVSAQAANQGTRTARNISITFFRDANGDSLCQPGETVLHQEQWDSLAGPRVCSFAHPAQPEGAYRLAVSASCDSETVSANNHQSLGYIIGSPLVVNEIMYDPNPGAPEWAELFNRSGGPVDLCGWTLEDANHSPQNITAVTQPVLPGEFILLAPDTTYLGGTCPKIKISGWPGLNSDGDLVCLRDSRGAAADRVEYRPSWGGGDGRSLERINPLLPSQEAADWGGCVDPGGSTPGARNSIYIENLKAGASLNISPNPFSPDGDGAEDRTLIGFELGWTRALVNLKIFDRLGRPVKTLAGQQFFGAAGTVVWDGRDDGGRICPTGIYIVLLEAKDANGARSVKKKQALALARKL